MKKLALLVFFISFIVMGCAGAVKYTDTVRPVNLEHTQKTKIKTNVLANANEWRNSGVIVEEGKEYKISSEGRWSIGLGKWTGPDGIGDTIEIGTGPLKEWGLSILIGKIGSHGFPFAIGNKYEFEAEKTGVLYFKINDVEGGVFDNKGYMTVTTSLKGPIIKTEAIQPENQIQAIKSKKFHPSKMLDLTAKRWAVIIGISRYQYSGQDGLTNLIFADDDAKAFKRSLQTLGWSDSHIKLLINETATQRNILIALESWLTKAGPNDQITVFWAGHGFPDPEDPEKVYFACYDTDMNIPATGYRMDRVRSILEERNVKNVVMLADTCHAGKLITRGNRGVSIVPNIEKMRREQKIPKGWIFMVGADTDRQAIEHSSWSNGAFTHSLIKGLGGGADGYESAGPKDGIVTMGELKAYMNTAMPNETQKVLGVAKRPVITTSTGDPDIWNLTLQAE